MLQDQFDLIRILLKQLFKILPVDDLHSGILQRHHCRAARLAGDQSGFTKETVRIAVTICMSNGVFIKRKNLNYESLQKFVEKLEALC